MDVNTISYGGIKGMLDAINATGEFTVLTVQNPLYVPSDPVQPNEAATKQYVDNVFSTISASNFTTGTISPSRMPSFTGDVSNQQGSTIFNLTPNIVTPGVYTKVNINSKGLITNGSFLTLSDIPNVGWNKITTGLPTTLTGYGITDALSINGGTLTGPLSVSGTPVLNFELINKQYVDNILSQLNTLVTGDIIKKAYSTTPIGFLRCNGALISQTAYSNLYSVIGDTYTTISSNSQFNAGRPWKQQFNLNTTNTDTDLISWTSSINTLPVGLYDFQTLITNSKIYLIGGVTTSGYSSTVYEASITSLGNIGSWTTSVNSLPIAISNFQVILTSTRAYLLGGYDGTNWLNSVYESVINIDGTLGPWTLTSLTLPTPLSHSQVIVIKDRVYLLGGHNGTSWTNSVSSALINTDGTLSNWVIETSIPSNLAYSQVVLTSNKVYLIGGFNGTSWISSVYTAPITVNNTIGTWSSSLSSLPSGVGQGQVIVTKSNVYLLGGYNGTSFLNTAYRAPINPDGTLGSWVSITNLPIALSSFQAVVTEGNLYILGGKDLLGPANTIYKVPFSGGTNNYYTYLNGVTTNPYPGLFRLPDTSVIDAKENINHFIKI